MKRQLLISFAWPLVLQPSLSIAYWRMACSVSQTARVDLILNPGGVSGHVHKFAGGSNVNQNSDFYSLQSSSCSSCEVQADKSAYWTPQLYYAHANGTFEEVPNYGMTVYYVGRGGDSSNTVPFPAGFKMLTGDSRLRSYDDTTLTYLNTRPVADRVSFHCINEANDIPEEHYMFRTDCSNGMRAQVNFQSCWDGVNLYLENNAHVDYLSGIDYGECPPSHPVPIPGLFFEVLYMTNSIDQSAGGQFVFSNGDTTGYGFHGDFLNGWDMNVQTSAVQDCLYTDNGGVVGACSSLAPSDNVNFPRDCLEQPSVFDEPVHGLLSALPGCNPITSGPDAAPQIICPLGSNTPAVSDASSSFTAAATSTTYSSESSATAGLASSSTDISTSSTYSPEGTTTAASTTESSLSISIVTVTLSNSMPSLSTTSELPLTSTVSVASSATSQPSDPPTSELVSSIDITDGFSASSLFGFSSTFSTTSSNNGGPSSLETSFPTDLSIGGIFVTVSSDITGVLSSEVMFTSSVGTISDVPTSTESSGADTTTMSSTIPSETGIIASTVTELITVTETSASSVLMNSVVPSSTSQQPAAPTTITSTFASNISSSDFFPIPTTLDASVSFACSLYANFSIQGCPPPTAGTSSPISPTVEITTAVVTVTQLADTATDSPSDTPSTESFATAAATTVFRIRGREVFLTSR
ncbi:hypothetical protein, variant [Phialophora macrospora]|uniref:DUF1996 domain-containing protein n=1 Tax=Phialophora macrospora TaxID=1851006 RepID=A0A0D2GM27_9EURO|nr:hypothetical protein PV04_01564 [Phialophora macrospora]KIW73444.1 hypothetical protein, variant [Phialophora macrospora]